MPRRVKCKPQDTPGDIAFTRGLYHPEGLRLILYGERWLSPISLLTALALGSTNLGRCAHGQCHGVGAVVARWHVHRLTVKDIDCLVRVRGHISSVSNPRGMSRANAHPGCCR